MGVIWEVCKVCTAMNWNARRSRLCSLFAHLFWPNILHYNRYLLGNVECARFTHFEKRVIGNLNLDNVD